jgi:hypothetical protein
LGVGRAPSLLAARPVPPLTLDLVSSLALRCLSSGALVGRNMWLSWRLQWFWLRAVGVLRELGRVSVAVARAVGFT